MEEENILNNYLIAINQGVKDDLDDSILRNCEQYLAKKQDEEVVLCKVVALAKLGRYQQGSQLLNSLKHTDDRVKLVKAYLAYRLGHFQESLDVAESTMNDLNMDILRAQVYAKKENYEMSCNILSTLISEKKEQISDIYEDLCANFFNSLALFIWTTLSVKRK